ncbi:hypothetical protein IW261DRAFT_1572278 [Armillaria novae-zelandiae]|uniref:Uncharacterized protein n=1 Tax=Armillaria novae-zelandiae TaxID=153914 RepID=A0AA39NST9_9AGAR|nr:hypothetical protein IW261DRAFT_1572278 [Armillaria novae-zelandiae]
MQTFNATSLNTDIYIELDSWTLTTGSGNVSRTGSLITAIDPIYETLIFPQQDAGSLSLPELMSPATPTPRHTTRSMATSPPLGSVVTPFSQEPTPASPRPMSAYSHPSPFSNGQGTYAGTNEPGVDRILSPRPVIQWTLLILVGS